RSAYRTRITVGGLGYTLSLSPQRQKRARSREIEIGAPEFDSAHCLEGDPSVALAVLDAETRRRMTHLLAGFVQGNRIRADLRDGLLRVWLRDGSHLSADSLAQVLGETIDVAQRLVVPRQIAARMPPN